MTSSAFAYVKPAVVLLLTGMALAYAFTSGRGEAMTGEQAPAAAPTKVAIAIPVQAKAGDEIAAARARLRSLASNQGSRAAGGIDPEALRALASLHRRTQDPAAAKLKRDQVLRDLETSHRAEAVDAEWSATSETRIVDAATTPVMARAGFKPQDLSTTCRSRTCRISARFASSIDAQDWADRLLTQMGPTLTQAKVAVVPLPGGQYEVRVYGARKA